MKSSRRRFIHSLAGISSLSILSQNGLAQNLVTSRFPISCNAYNWTTFYKRENRIWGEDMNSCMAEFSRTGIKAYEPSLENVEQAVTLIPILKKYQISMPSVYVNSIMHREEEVENSIQNVIAIADEVGRYGTKIMVTNPSPIRWGGEELKSDEQLIIQAAAIERLGKALRERGITLAYHTHAPEFLAGAREFHHVMLNTSPENVSFCFDIHWVYRGSVDSQVAVFDILKLYGKRVVELHVRQSLNGIWTETFGEGDIDYARLVKELKAMNVFPHIVIEQCVEAKTPHTMTGLEAHLKDRLAVEKTFAPLMQ